MDNEFNEQFDIDFNISDEDRIIKIEDENGETKDYELIANITTETGDFVVYTDNTKLPDGKIALYVNSVINEDGEITFDEVEEEELNEILKEIRGRL